MSTSHFNPASPPRIAVIGVGAMGSIYAGFFAEAGYAVSVVDVWAAHIAAIAAKGLPTHQPCLLYTSPSPRDLSTSRMPSSA